MKVQHLIFSALVALFLVELYSVMRPQHPRGIRDGFSISGALHVSAGDGSAKRALEISEAARRSGLEFVVFADLDRTLTKAQIPSPTGVDFYPEIELSTPAGHALFFHSHTPAAGSSVKHLRELAWSQYLGDESVPGAFVVVAHPSSLFQPWERLDRYANGIELMNLKSLLEQQILNRPASFALAFLLAPLNSYLALLHLYDFPEHERRAWDASHTLSPGHFGIIGTDESAQMPWLDKVGIRIPPIRLALGAASTSVFLSEPRSENFEERRRQIYSALRAGHSAMVLHALHPFAGNDWKAVCGIHSYRAGDRFALSPGCEFQVRLPPTLSGSKRLVLLRDGVAVEERPGAANEEAFRLETPGVYRLEVWVKQTSAFRLALNREVPYLLYNPLHVR